MVTLPVMDDDTDFPKPPFGGPLKAVFIRACNAVGNWNVKNLGLSFFGANLIFWMINVCSKTHVIEIPLFKWLKILRQTFLREVAFFVEESTVAVRECCSALHAFFKNCSLSFRSLVI